MYVNNYIGNSFELGFLVVAMEVRKIGTSLYCGHEALRNICNYSGFLRKRIRRILIW